MRQATRLPCPQPESAWWSRVPEHLMIA